MKVLQAGGAVLMAAVVATAAIAVTRPDSPDRSTSSAPAGAEPSVPGGGLSLPSSAGPSVPGGAGPGGPGGAGPGGPGNAGPGGAELDGYRLTRLPAGVVRTGSDSTFTTAVGAPADDVPASVAMRRFDRGVGIGLFVTVLRPEPGTDPASGAARLARWAAAGTAPVRAFAVPIGAARLLAYAGTEVTTHTVVITTPDHVVITIEANAAFSAAELVAVAHGITDAGGRLRPGPGT